MLSCLCTSLELCVLYSDTLGVDGSRRLIPVLGLFGMVAFWKKGNTIAGNKNGNTYSTTLAFLVLAATFLKNS